MAGPQQAEVSLGTLQEAYGPDAFRSLFKLFVAFYPSVQPMRNWTTDFTYYFNTKTGGNRKQVLLHKNHREGA